MNELQPFADESSTLEVGGLTVENRLDRVQFYGSLHITKDKEGYENALRMRQLFNDVVSSLESSLLPDKVAIVPTTPSDNPFFPNP